jgi:3-hydroxybutyryl-CoA dehydratase
MLNVGDRFELNFTFSEEAVRGFAEVTGDKNPIHLDPEFARTTVFGRPIVHGMFVGGLISRALGCHFPGAGTIYMSQSLKFLAPVFVGESVRIELVLTELGEKGRGTISTTAFRSDGTRVVEGEALVKLPKGAG